MTHFKILISVNFFYSLQQNMYLIEFKFVKSMYLRSFFLPYLPKAALDAHVGSNA